MTTRKTAGLIRIVAAVVLIAAVFAGSAGPAAAGGWAVASLDSVPIAEPGATTDVSFTILQHGIRPADLDEGVGIEIRHDDGRSEFFPATGDGTPGRYVATVTFPAGAGTYEWLVQMGWFGPHELGALNVRTPDGDAGGAWSAIRWLTLAGSVLLGGIAVADMAVRHRRRPALG